MIAINKYIVVDKIVEDVKSSSGLIMSAEDQYDVRYNRGIVHVPGTEVKCVQAGDEIYYDKAAGHQVRIEGVLRTVIREIDVVLCFPRLSSLQDHVE